MPDTAPLSRRDGVELVRTGRWDISTGQWTAAREDLTAAVAALSCPAVQKPIVKIGHTDRRFTPGDGEPAIGWYENLRITDGGHTLIADQVAPSWLTDVQAAAWPNRSVEGSYNKRCGLGHTHPFVLTAVSLLGVTPPGVSTLTPLNSLADVKTLFGLAASDAAPDAGEVRIAASVPGDLTLHVDAAEQTVHTGAMVALIPTAADAARLAVEGGEPVDELHVTLLYLGEAAEFSPKAKAAVIDAVRRATGDVPTIDAHAHAFAVSVFNPPGSASPDGRDRDTCLVLGISGDDLGYAQAVTAAAAQVTALQFSVELPENHKPWVPHLTLTYTDDLSQIPALAARTGPVVFDRVRIAFAGERVDIPLTAVDLADIYGHADPVAAAAADTESNQLKRYWLHGEGLKKWATSPHPWTALYRHLKKHVDSERAKRIASEWFHEHFGYWPGSKEHRASADLPGEDTMPNPTPSLVERIHSAWNAAGQPEQQWIVEAAPDEVIVMDNTDRSLVRVPVTVAGDSIEFGAPQRVRPAYVPADDQVAAARMVFASAEESRPPALEQPPHDRGGNWPPGEPATAPVLSPAEGEAAPAEPAPGEPAPTPPAAEPEPNPTDPKEDPVSTLSTDVRSRLGLPATADDAAVLAALDGVKAKADTAPNPELVAAARDEMKSEITRLSGELAEIRAGAAKTAKQALFDAAVQVGRIKPADRPKWEERYDRAPEVTADILASLAPNTEVPVAATGYTGDVDQATGEDGYDTLVAGIDGPFATTGGN
ncbi:hypothetical protein OOJ91_12250 [Micromonospora lupini]|uniref:hypothetical protein n=1 Tax=Micromonospora lupini TaxID=285679 RepID=UPI00224C97FD|nr:hypothetical protein [Micromonospora lupini]MCX5066650.1 hypothetical protein [Micromonospora lupini]